MQLTGTYVRATEVREDEVEWKLAEARQSAATNRYTRPLAVRTRRNLRRDR